MSEFRKGLRNEWDLSINAVRRAIGFWKQAADTRDALRDELAAERTRHIELLDEMDACCDDRTRLRAEIAAQADVHTQIQMQLSDERDALRALLKEARNRLMEEGVLYSEPLNARIDAALNKGETCD